MESKTSKRAKSWFQVLIPCKQCGLTFIYSRRIVCENCAEAYYCSRKCYLEDSISHKNDCTSFHNDTSKISQGVDTTVPSGLSSSKGTQKKFFFHVASKSPEGIIITCLQCKRKCNNNLLCGNCKYAYYCSPDCILKDEASHQEKCDTVILFRYVDDRIFHGETYNYLKHKGLTKDTKTSPLLLDLIHEFAHILTGPYVPVARPAIIVQIISPYPHSWRDAIVVRDIDLITTHIIFHNDQRNEASMTGGPNVDRDVVTKVPLSFCLKPGNFIILLDAWWHLFKDFKTGVRIDSLEKVHFLWMD